MIAIILLKSSYFENLWKLLAGLKRSFEMNWPELKLILTAIGCVAAAVGAAAAAVGAAAAAAAVGAARLKLTAVYCY